MDPSPIATFQGQDDVIKQIKNATMSMATIVEPTGVPARIATRIPTSEQMTEMIAAATVTEKKLLNTRIAESAGNTTNAETSNAPTRFIARTMMTAMMMAMRRLNEVTFTPVARAKFSSKVIAKILW